MKKFIAFLSITAILVIVIISCSKNIDKVPKNVGEKPPMVKSGIDTMYMVTDSSFYVSSVMCDSFDVQYIEVKPDEYQIYFDQDHPYGYFCCDIELPADARGPFIIISITIKIAKRYSKHCPENYCTCGIGFRCGFISWDDGDHSGDTDADRYKNVTLSLNATTNKLCCTFEEAIAWNTIGWQFE